jgi:predicted nuclease of predicted toxin-antitoxin system
VKFLLDENLSPDQAFWLRQTGFDAVSAYTVGLRGAADEEVRRFAIESDRVLVTLDADFGQIHRFPPKNTPGVVRLKIHPPTEQAIQALLLATLSALQSHELRGKLAVADEHKIRVRSG